MKFSLKWNPMFYDILKGKILQKCTILKKKESRLDIWWTATIPQNVALSRFMVYNKTCLRTTTEACSTTIYLLAQSSRATNDQCCKRRL